MLASRTWFQTWPLLVLVVLTVSTLPALATDVCEVSTRPAATLLFPYFEVDLAEPGGRDTLISINNAGAEPTVARVTVWTNVGLPSLGFDLVLDPRDVQSISLRDLMAGRIPVTSIGTELADCQDPLVLPEPGPDEVADLVAWHTGAADQSGLCRGVAGDEPSLATGYVTVDAMNRCSPFFTYPGDLTVHDGDVRYFEDGGGGLAANHNVLWGDLILIDPDNDAAQSVAAQHVRADADRFTGSTRTFYGLGADDRAPLPSTYRGRFLAGQPAGTETTFLLWLDPVSLGSFPENGFTCGEESVYANFCRYLAAQAYDETGSELGDSFFEGTPTVLRTLNIAPNAGAGFVETVLEELVACVLLPAGVVQHQAAMIPRLRSQGRFSIASAAVALDSTCQEPTP